MEKLKVGDKVCHKQYYSWSNIFTYEFSEVERLTSTRAVLKNGFVLINEPEKNYYNKNDPYHFNSYGKYNDSKWWIVQYWMIEEWDKEKQRQVINRWFDSNIKKFTDEEKKQIYEALSNTKHTGCM